MGYSWDFGALLGYVPAFIKGVYITFLLAALSSVAGTLAGIPLAILLRRSTFVSTSTKVFVDVIRAIPNLVLIFFFYYFPYKQMFGFEGFSPFLSALVALSIAQAAYSADMIRSSLEQVPRIQILGLRGLGMRQRDITRHLTVPFVIKNALPGHVALWIGNVKLSSLSSVIGVEDVVFVAKVAMAQSFRSLEAWIIVGTVYASLVFPLAYGMRRLEGSKWIQRQ